MNRKGLYLGAISGTSMDGIDVVLAEIGEDSCRTLASHSNAYPEELKSKLISLCIPGENEIERAGSASVEVALLIARTANELLKSRQLDASQIEALGSHGQTIRHSVDHDHAFSLQIGDPSTIAQHTGITTIADFRMADIAAGGQGAPLAPTFHAATFASTQGTRIIINLGGIANITVLQPGQKPIGYDTGPASTLMDQWIQQHQGKAYDDRGQWARSGRIVPEMLDLLLSEPYLQLSAPKSTGRELFNLPWLQRHLAKISDTTSPEDIQRSLLEYTAITLSKEILRHCTDHSSELYCCGGGVHNTFLMERLQAMMPDFKLDKTDTLGVHTQDVEACTFAWLAHKTMHRLSGNLPSVTGAGQDKILGGVYFP